MYKYLLYAKFSTQEWVRLSTYSKLSPVHRNGVCRDQSLTHCFSELSSQSVHMALCTVPVKSYTTEGINTTARHSPDNFFSLEVFVTIEISQKPNVANLYQTLE